jgi:hypothetical protein
LIDWIEGRFGGRGAWRLMTIGMPACVTQSGYTQHGPRPWLSEWQRGRHAVRPEQRPSRPRGVAFPPAPRNHTTKKQHPTATVITPVPALCGRNSPLTPTYNVSAHTLYNGLNTNKQNKTNTPGGTQRVYHTKSSQQIKPKTPLLSLEPNPAQTTQRHTRRGQQQNKWGLEERTCILPTAVSITSLYTS